MLLFPLQRLLLGVRLGLRDIGSLFGSVGAVAIDRRTLCRSHGRHPSGFRPRRGLKLLHLGGEFLLPLAVIGIAARLDLLLGLEARNLLWVR